MNAFNNFNFENWWRLMAAVGGLIAIGSVARIFVPGLLIGSGFLCIGVGEWINHDEKAVKETVDGLKGFKVVNKQVRMHTIAGNGFDGVGAALVAWGTTIIAFAP